METKIYDRQTGKLYDEKQVSPEYLAFLYGNRLGRALLKAVFSRAPFSKAYSLMYNSKRSAERIKPFIDEFAIDMSCCESDGFQSFNEFFTRRALNGSRPICSDSGALVSPADSKLRVYNIDDSLRLKIKSTEYTVSELLRDKALSKEFAGGLCLVFRLTVDNLHRYCWCADGNLCDARKLRGVLHTVGPMSEGIVKALSDNQREYSVFNSRKFGKMVQMEIGALTVGKIVNNIRTRFKKGEEKGYFCYGGSTIVVLLQKNAVAVDADIAANSAKGIETAVLMGERVAQEENRND